jgi:uncharacterized protein YdbL (DUF1318 family)
MKQLFKATQTIIALILMVLSINAFGLTLDEAKANGLVGEQNDGYVGVVSNTPEASALAAEVNEKRKEAYGKVAQKNGIAIAKVAELAGKKLIEKVAPGGYYQAASGQWVKK